jgi:hypothetical protein
MKRLLFFAVVFAACLPLCFFLISYIGNQLNAMDVSRTHPADLLLWAVFVSLGISVSVVWRQTRVRRKKKKTSCKSVNFFSLKFRA